jgi:2'-5' RNA ligase
MSIRCFIAVECNNEEMIRRFIAVQRRLERTGADIKSVEPENIHLTLKFLGDVEPSRAEEVSNVIQGISCDSFDMKVEGVGVFPHPGHIRIIWAGVTKGSDPLNDIFDEIEGKLRDIGFKKEKRKLHPHLTICRVRSARNKEHLLDEINLLRKEGFGTIHVDKVVFKKSELTQKGPIYTTLAKSK